LLESETQEVMKFQMIMPAPTLRNCAVGFPDLLMSIEMQPNTTMLKAGLTSAHNTPSQVCL